MVFDLRQTRRSTYWGYPLVSNSYVVDARWLVDGSYGWLMGIVSPPVSFLAAGWAGLLGLSSPLSLAGWGN